MHIQADPRFDCGTDTLDLGAIGFFRSFLSFSPLLLFTHTQPTQHAHSADVRHFLFYDFMST